MTEPTPRSQPLVRLMKVVTRSRSVASSTLMMATQLSIPLPGSTGGKFWSERIKQVGLEKDWPAAVRI